MIDTTASPDSHVDPVHEPDLARRVLSGRDGDLARLLDAAGDPGPLVWPEVEAATGGDAFAELVLHIIGRGRRGDVALRIHQRLRDGLGGTIDPLAVVVASPSDVRAAGVPGAQARALRDVARRVLDGRLSFTQLARRSDADAQATLEHVHGIPAWSAQMFLLHHARRPDVLPADDPTLLAAAQSSLALPVRPSAALLARRATRWRPFRSYAAALLWASAGLHPYRGA